MEGTKVVEMNETIEAGAVSGYKKIEDGVVAGYKKIERGVVNGYKKIEESVVKGYKKLEEGTMRKAVKVTGALAKGTGVVALSAVTASKVAVDAVVDGFKSAGNAVKNVLAEEKVETDEMMEEENVAEEAMETKLEVVE